MQTLHSPTRRTIQDYQDARTGWLRNNLLGYPEWTGARSGSEGILHEGIL